jgi:hypothetical protein
MLSMKRLYTVSLLKRSLRAFLHSDPGGRDSTPVRGVPYEPAIIRLRGALAEPRLSRFDSESWCWVCSQLFDRFAAFL